MLTDESLLGVRRADPNQLKPLKLQLPLNYVLALHRMRIAAARNVSEIVADALQQYFEDLRAEREQLAAARA